MDASILVTGETVVDFLPERPGALSNVAGFERRPGGAPANVAVGLTRLENPPLFWTRVGDDPFGQFLLEVLTDHGLPSQYFERDPTAQTTLAFVTHDETGDRTFSFYRENTADTQLQPGTVDDETLAGLEWVHAGGLALSQGPSRAATLDVIERAADHGCTVSFDPNARPEVWDEGEFARVTSETLTHVDVLKATVDELRAIGFEGETPDELADAVFDAGPHTVFITRGSEGAIGVATDDAPWTGIAEHAGFDIDVVDTTGAGDAFMAGTIAGLTDGQTLEETLAFASAVAATSTTAPGAMTALPERDDVESILARDVRQ